MNDNTQLVPVLLAELKQARNYVAVIANRTAEKRVHDDLKSIDAAIARAETKSGAVG